MARIAALTHVRQDDFFLQIWVDYYSALVGAENCFVVLDGDDWSSNVDLSRVNVSVNTLRAFRRIKHDALMAQMHTRMLADLLNHYDFVIRGDCDELVMIDPASDKTWDDICDDMQEKGYLFCSGVDIVHNRNVESVLDLSKPILGQRQHGIIIGSFFKPNLMCQSLPIKAGGHGIKERQVIISPDVFMFHIGNVDHQLAHERALTRNSSYTDYYKDRLAVFDAVLLCEPKPKFDRHMAFVRNFVSGVSPERQVLGRPLKFRAGNIAIGLNQGLLSKIPERFIGTV